MVIMLEDNAKFHFPDDNIEAIVVDPEHITVAMINSDQQGIFKSIDHNVLEVVNWSLRMSSRNK